MQLNEVFDFGKYKGLTLQEVYQGTNNINKELLKGYLSDKLKSIHLDETNEGFLLDIMDFEISETFLRVKPVMEDLEGDWSKALEELFRNGNNQVDRIIGNTFIDDFNINKFSINKGKPELTEGNPKYVEWCIKNVKEFFISPNQIIELISNNVYCFVGIEVTHKTKDIYEYSPKITTGKYRFTNEIITINNEKYESNNFNIENEFDTENEFGNFFEDEWNLD